jgi:hypothetical protein
MRKLQVTLRFEGAMAAWPDALEDIVNEIDEGDERGSFEFDGGSAEWELLQAVPAA